MDTKDDVLLRRFVANWDVTIDETAADVNCDGSVDTKGVVLLRRYVAGWGVTLGK